MKYSVSTFIRVHTEVLWPVDQNYGPVLAQNIYVIPIHHKKPFAFHEALEATAFEYDTQNFYLRQGTILRFQVLYEI